MRLIGTLSGKFKPEVFSQYLSNQGIENEFEVVNDEFGEGVSYRIWIRDEDQVEKAEKFLEHFQNDPHADQFKVAARDSNQEKTIKKTIPSNQRLRFLSPSPYGFITILTLILVTAIFLWSQMSRAYLIPPDIPGIIRAPMLAPIERVMLYDYPEYFQLRDKLFEIFTPKEIEEKKPIPPEAGELITKIRGMSTWMGIYERVVAYARDRNYPLLFDGPMFEKIRQGEIWRTFTPALLHFNLIHIFFNVLWFILLGNQIEFRVGTFKYLLFILITGIVSNTAQYLMSGPFFMGLSGVICAMAGFIWARQQVAPWEGYLLHRFTLIFLGIFIIGMFFLQLAFFFMQIFGNLEAAPVRIANTAHLIGALAGYILGRLPLFVIRHRKKT